MSNVLITGGTGSLGSALVPVLLQQQHVVTILSRDPHKQAILLARYPTLKVILGDIRNRDMLLYACAQQDIVIHAAALKRVERGDTDTREYQQVNVLGSLNVAEACRLNGVGSALFISSDKEVEPVNFYGLTKALGVRLWLAEQSNYSLTKFSGLRYGNVVESNGSVYHVWEQRMLHGQPLIVREPEPTRFFLSLTDAVNLVLMALQHMQGGEIFVPANVPAFSLWDLAKEFRPENTWQKEPLLPTEKPHEILVAHTEYVEPVPNCTALWRIWPHRQPVIYETAPMFNSLEANKLTGAEVLRRLRHDG